ncbi:MAG TPA: thioredoxin domain-containing protein [Candidatus Limnocylindrales bacterium]|nr:thioredoxin domain-containing protein [Candidatus Limnocylindrales bacterium]
MTNTTRVFFSLTAVAAMMVSACADPQQVSDIKAAVERIEAQQKDLATKIEGIEKSQKDVLAKVQAAPAARPAADAPDPNKRHDIPVGNSFSKGPADAPVTVVEWSDFQCPFCSQATALIKQITEAYPNDVRVVYKNYPLPFHQHAMPAAKAAIAAGKQGKFWEMHDKLFENYRTLSDEKYIEFATQLGLNIDKFKADMAAPETAALISEEMKQAGQVGVRGTPSFFINGKQPAGRSFELYKSIIDEELKAKKKS